MLTTCPACQGALNGHHYAQFAMTIATKDNHQRMIQLFEALKGHRWIEAIRFQDFDGRYNAAEAFALRCPSGAMTVLIVCDPEELLESNRLLECEVLDMPDAQGLSEAIESCKWQELDDENSVAS